MFFEHSSMSNLSSPTFFFFTDTAPTEIYTLSLHDALPIYQGRGADQHGEGVMIEVAGLQPDDIADDVEDARNVVRLQTGDRKSTRLNSSHQIISYAVFCLKKKKKHMRTYDVEQSCMCGVAQ